MKLVIISLDLMLALPILALGLAVLFSSIVNSQTYLLAFAGLQNKTLDLFTTSQQIAHALDANQVNGTTAAELASDIALGNGVAAGVLDVGSAADCVNALTLCRIVTVSGAARLLVVSYENAG